MNSVDLEMFAPTQTIDDVRTLASFGFKVKEIDIGFPSPKTEYITVPHSSTVLDFTAMFGRPAFGMRTIKATMLYIGTWADWHTAINAFAKYAQGVLLNIVDTSDDAFYYVGRCNSVPTHDSYYMAPIEITWDCLPFKYAVQGTADPWLWDPFNFLTGIAVDTGSITVSGSGTMIMPDSPQPVTPHVTTDADMTIEYNGQTFKTGIITDQTIAGFVVDTEQHTATITGTGTIKIDYRRASL